MVNNGAGPVGRNLDIKLEKEGDNTSRDRVSAAKNQEYVSLCIYKVDQDFGVKFGPRPIFMPCQVLMSLEKVIQLG